LDPTTTAPESTRRPTGTPTVPIRQFAREKLRDEPAGFVNAVCRFIDATFYTESAIGKPKYHQERLAREIRKINLSDGEIGRSFIVGRQLYDAYFKQADGVRGSRDSKLSAVSIIEGIKRQERKRLERERNLKFGLERKFTNLMEVSDTKLRIVNSNKRVDFAGDPVFQNSNSEDKEKIRERKMTKNEYGDRRKAIRARQDAIALTMHTRVEEDKFWEYVRGSLEENPSLRHRLGKELFMKFCHYVLVLLRGDELSRGKLSQEGLNPNEVLGKAKSTLGRYHLDRAEKERIMRNPLPREVRMIARIGIDPVAYEQGSVIRKKK